MARFLQDFVQYSNAVFSSDILGNIARNTARNTAKNTNKAVQITGLISKPRVIVEISCDRSIEVMDRRAQHLPPLTISVLEVDAAHAQ